MRLLLSLLVLLVGSEAAFSQNGNYFLSHFSPSREKSDHLSFDLIQDDRGVIYSAGKEGIEEFDGRNWRLVPMPGVAYTLAQSNNNIFAGGLAGFGRIYSDAAQGWKYQDLAADQSVKNIFGSLALNTRIYFINEDYLFGVSVTTGKTELKLQAPENSELTLLFEYNGEVYVCTSAPTIWKVEGNKFAPVTLALPADQLLFVEKQFNSNTYLVGTASNRLFRMDNEKGVSEIIVKDQSYLDSHVVSDGAWLNENVAAIGTLRGGVVFIDVATGETKEIVDYNTGLPDNEVFAILSDKRQGIWVAHNDGYTRIASNVPFRIFSHYKGLSGNLLCVQSIQGGLYVGTSVGLFMLTKEEVYDDEIYYVTKTTIVKNKKKTEEIIPQETPVPKERQRAKRGLFGFLKKKKDDEEAGKPAAITQAPAQKTAPSVIKSQEKRTRKVLRSLDYAYKKVAGIEGKVTQLWELQGTILAAGPSGLYQVAGDQSHSITSEPVRSFTVTHNGTLMVAATYDDEVKTFQLDGQEWNQILLLDTLQTFVSFLFEDKQHDLWLCGLDAIYKAELDSGAMVDIVKIPFSNPTMAETFGMAAGSDVYVMIAGKFLKFDFGKQKFITTDSLGRDGKSLIAGNRFWYFDGHNWRSLDQKLTEAFKLEWLNLFPKLRFITPDDKNENLWAITSSNELFRLSGKDLFSDQYKYPLFLKEVKNSDARVNFATQHVELSQEQGGVTFGFIQPEYSGLQSTEYRYRVKGLQKDWSAWSALNNEISLPFLPVGEYQVMIESRNIFGDITQVAPVDVVVLPPYWKRTWFYGMEAAVFSILVLLSIQLSALNERYRLISRLLSLLTIIMFIQLIQTAVYSYIDLASSPVMDFFVQVSVALLVLPLESVLRKFMLRAAEGRFRFRKKDSQQA